MKRASWLLQQCAKKLASAEPLNVYPEAVLQQILDQASCLRALVVSAESHCRLWRAFTVPSVAQDSDTDLTPVLTRLKQHQVLDCFRGDFALLGLKLPNKPALCELELERGFAVLRESFARSHGSPEPLDPFQAGSATPVDKASGLPPPQYRLREVDGALLIRVDLPALLDARDTDLHVEQRSLVLKFPEGTYSPLSLALPFNVACSAATAKFSKKQRVLKLRLLRC